MQCPICKTESTEQLLGTGDNTIFRCPLCTNYKLAGRAVLELQSGVLTVTNIEAFRELVRQKKGTSDEYPLITPDDISGLPQ
jgi:hypothetical protein